MKKISLFAIAFAASLVISGCANTCDVKVTGLADRESHEAAALASTGDKENQQVYYRDDGTIDFVDEYGFNGKIIKTVYYTQSQVVESIIEYDSSERIKTQTFYNEDGSVNSYIQATEYFEDGSYSDAVLYGADDIKICDIVYSEDYSYKYIYRNEDESLSEIYCYNADSSMSGVIVYEYFEDGYYNEINYNSDGIRTKCTTYTPENEIDSYYVIEERNADNSALKMVWYNSDDVMTEYSLIESYFDNGYIEKETFYFLDGTMNYTTEYYENGSVFKDSYYDYTGKINYSVEFNEEGYAVKKTWYADGKVDYYAEVTERNDDGKSVSDTFYDADGKKTDTYVYEYDTNGLIKKTTSYELDGEMAYYEIYTYSSDNSLKRKDIHSPDGSLEGYVTYEYNENGLEISSTVYNADGSKANVKDSNTAFSKTFGEIMEKSDEKKLNFGKIGLIVLISVVIIAVFVLCVVIKSKRQSEKEGFDGPEM